MFKIPQKQQTVLDKMPFYVHEKTFDVYVKTNDGIYQRIKDLKGCSDVLALHPLDLSRPELPIQGLKGESFQDNIQSLRVRKPFLPFLYELGLSNNTISAKIKTINDFFLIIKSMNVDKNELYLSDKKKKITFCNVYAYHILSAIGVYIPRIFWKEQTDLFSRGYDLYDNCVEYSANMLTDWLITNAGNELYPELELVNVQTDKTHKKLESGFNFDAIKTLGIISVFNQKGSGHIAILYRGNDGKLYATQAGAKNYQCDPNWLKWFSAPYLKHVLINVNLDKIK